MVKSVIEKDGRLDIVINNAGGQFPSPAQHISPNGFLAVVKNNLVGTFHVSREAANQWMIPQRGGRIVNVSSSGGLVSLPFVGVYHATKFALEGLSHKEVGEILGLNAKRIFNMDVSDRFPDAKGKADGMVDTFKQQVTPA